MKQKSVILVILDGWGVAPRAPGNAISLARKPNFDSLVEQYPVTLLDASGESVGLKSEEPGNSEAGHLNLGAGRLVVQDKVFITESIHDGSFFQNPVLQKVVEHTRRYKSKLHLIGLLSNGASAHSEPDHLEALLVLAKKNNLKNIYLHLFLDGRDTASKEAVVLLRKLIITMNNLQIGRIATLAGRYYAMDRGLNWERTRLAYEAMVSGAGPHVRTAYQAITGAYERGLTDEFVLPTVITDEGLIKNHDAVIFFNLRSDRARQLTKAFVSQQFKPQRKLFFVTLTDFGSDLPTEIAYPIRPELNSLSDYLGKYSTLHQLYVAEQEKFAHVTYFFHGGKSIREPNEVRIRIPSVPVSTFDQAPAMSAAAITKTVIDYLEKQIYNLVVINYANADMLGHTGLLKPAIKAIETLDQQLGRLVKFSAAASTALVVTADHGNAERMFDPLTAAPDNTHTTNPVPFIVVDKKFRGKKLRSGGALSDVSPTILSLLNLPQPREMTGRSLFTK